MGKSIKLSIFNRHLLRGQIEYSIGDTLLENGELLTRCPSCRIYCHRNRFLAYGNKCPRCSCQSGDYSSTLINSDITGGGELWMLPPIKSLCRDQGWT
jgi:hypothetical protein